MYSRVLRRKENAQFISNENIYNGLLFLNKTGGSQFIKKVSFGMPLILWIFMRSDSQTKTTVTVTNLALRE